MPVMAEGIETGSPMTVDGRGGGRGVGEIGGGGGGGGEIGCDSTEDPRIPRGAAGSFDSPDPLRGCLHSDRVEEEGQVTPTSKDDAEALEEGGIPMVCGGGPEGGAGDGCASATPQGQNAREGGILDRTGGGGGVTKADILLPMPPGEPAAEVCLMRAGNDELPGNGEQGDLDADPGEVVIVELTATGADVADDSSGRGIPSRASRGDEAPGSCAEAAGEMGGGGAAAYPDASLVAGATSQEAGMALASESAASEVADEGSCVTSNDSGGVVVPAAASSSSSSCLDEAAAIPLSTDGDKVGDSETGGLGADGPGCSMSERSTMQVLELLASVDGEDKDMGMTDPPVVLHVLPLPAHALPVDDQLPKADGGDSTGAKGCKAEAAEAGAHAYVQSPCKKRGVRGEKSTAGSAADGGSPIGRRTCPTVKRLKLTFRGDCSAALPAQPPAFPLGDVNRIITECFNQGKPDQALKVLKAMRTAGISPDRAQWELFHQVLQSSSASSQEFLENFGAEMVDMLEGNWPSFLSAFMPSDLPLQAALAAVKGHLYKVGRQVFSAMFSASREQCRPLPAALRSEEVLEAYLQTCTRIKEAPMPIDDLVAIGLVPLPSNSRLWSMAASAYALSNEPKDAFDLITYAEEMAPSSVVCAALITMDAETDALSSAICSGMGSGVFRGRMACLAERGVLSVDLCGSLLEKLLAQSAGRVDMASWEACLLVMVNNGAEMDARCHIATLQAALGARDVVVARLAMNRLHGVGGEAGHELEEAWGILEERERERRALGAAASKAGKEGEEDLNIATLKGKDPDKYLEFCFLAVRGGKDDLAVDAWLLLVERCGVALANECAETVFGALAGSGMIHCAMRCMEALQEALCAAGGKDRGVCLSHDAVTLGLRQCVIAKREMLGAWLATGSDGAEKKQRVELLEAVVELARSAGVCSQAFYTNAVQALEALARDEADSTRPLKSNEGARDVMVACHERMRAEGIVPSIEAYNIFVTAAGFGMLDVQRVESLIAEMRDKAGVAVPTPIAREALCGALAQADPMRAEKLLESLKHDGITPCDRCIRAVVEGLVAEGEPRKAADAARAHGCTGEEVKMTLLRGFVACGELESALELFAGFKEASIELPREFGDFVRALRGEEVQERADQEAQAMADEEQALKGSCETASLCGEEHHEHRGKWGGGGKGDVEMEDAGVEEGRVTLKVYEVEADVQRTERLAEEAC